ncbi:MAG: NAD(P)/FAD-dependent oxidoreductase [Actinomycetota bacterium]
MRPLNTSIVGGGVAGLALASGLHQRDLPFTMFERSNEFTDGGFGFILLANGRDALRELGIDLEPSEVGCEVSRSVMRTIDGEVVAAMELTDAVAVSRHDLLKVIRSTIPHEAIRLSQDFSHFDSDGTTVRAAVFEDGSESIADVFVGADGSRSRCREWITPAHPAPSGRVKEIVSMVSCPDLAEQVGSTFTKFMHPDGGLAVGLVPSGSGRVIWFVQFDTQRFATPERHDATDFLQSLLGDFPTIVQSAIAATDAAALRVWHTVDMDPPSSMVRANVALIGDAAHPLLPFTSQGANSALEDAADLVATVAACTSPDEVEPALRAYSHRRRPRRADHVTAGRSIAADFVNPISGAVLVPLDI